MLPRSMLLCTCIGCIRNRSTDGDITALHISFYNDIFLYAPRARTFCAHVTYTSAVAAVVEPGEGHLRI